MTTLTNSGLGRNYREGQERLELAKSLGLTPKDTKLTYDSYNDVYRFMVKK